MTAGTYDLSGTNTAIKRKRQAQKENRAPADTVQLSITTMPLEVCIEIAAKEAVQEAETFATQKVKKDKRNVQKRKSYVGLSEEKERAQRARHSDENKGLPTKQIQGRAGRIP